jgi:hypothetical protein
VAPVTRPGCGLKSSPKAARLVGSPDPADPPGGNSERVPVSDAIRDEKATRKAMLIRASIYIAGTHVFAGFVILLFMVGNRHH